MCFCFKPHFEVQGLRGAIIKQLLTQNKESDESSHEHQLLNYFRKWKIQPSSSFFFSTFFSTSCVAHLHIKVPAHSVDPDTVEAAVR